MGGEAKLAAIKSVKAELTLTQKTPQGEFPMQMETVIVYPDHLHAEMQTPDGTMDIVVTPDAAFMAIPGQGMRDFPASQKAETLEQIKRDPIFIASHAKDPNVFFHADGTEKVGDIEARIVDVNAARHRHPLVRRPADRPHSERNLSNAEPGPARTGRNRHGRLEASERPEHSVRAPQQAERSGFEHGGVQALEFNPTVDPKLFEKPAEKPPAQP